MATRSAGCLCVGYLIGLLALSEEWLSTEALVVVLLIGFSLLLQSAEGGGGRPGRNPARATSPCPTGIPHGPPKDVVAMALDDCPSEETQPHCPVQRAQPQQHPQSMPHEKAHMNGLLKARRWQEVLHFFDDVRQSWVEPQVSFYNVALHACRSALLPDLASQTLTDLRADGLAPDTQTYIELIMLMRKSQRYSEVFRLYNEMQKEGVVPDRFIYHTVMNSCYWSGQSEKIWDVFGDMLRRGEELDQVSHSTLVRMLPGGDGVMKFMDGMQEQGVVASKTAYHSLICLCHRDKDPETALQLFQRMIQAGVEPDPETYGFLIDLCSKHGSPIKGLELFDDMQRRGLDANVLVHNSVLGAFNRCNQQERTWMMYTSMKQRGPAPDVITYSTMISTCKCAGDLESALLIFQEMQAANVKPNEVVYTKLIHTSVACNQVSMALDLLETMEGEGVTPNFVARMVLQGACLNVRSVAEGGRLNAALQRLKVAARGAGTPQHVRHHRSHI